eukprot:Selendium_serpulae@DN5397_c0_g1_i3.p1
MGGSQSAEPPSLTEQLQPAQRIVQVGAAPSERFVQPPGILRTATDPGFLERANAPVEVPATPAGIQIQPNTVALENPVNLKTDSIRFVPIEGSDSKYAISFSLAAKAPVAISVHFQPKEVKDDVAGLRFNSQKTVSGNAEIGPHQTFRSPESDGFDLKSVPRSQKYCEFVVELRATALPVSQKDLCTAEISYITAERNDRGWSAHVSKKKNLCGTKEYEIHDIFGMASDNQPGSDDGRDCVICLTEKRTTAVLPCRHMCLCNGCADIMRMQSNKCPICRQNVTSLIQISIRDSTRPAAS